MLKGWYICYRYVIGGRETRQSGGVKAALDEVDGVGTLLCCI